MADWVLKGSIKGPQGDPGADAQLPEGGTTGDFLQKKSDGTGWFNSEGLLRASYIGNLQQLGDAGQSLEIHNVSVTSNGYVAGASTENPPEDGAFVYADDKNSTHLGHNRVGVSNGIPYVDLDTTDATGENGHLAADGRYSYVDDIEAADAAEEQGEALTIPTGAAVKQYVEAHAGDPLPEGGTDGQVLTSDGAGGAAWESVPQPDLSGYIAKPTGGNVNDVLVKSSSGAEWVSGAVTANLEESRTNVDGFETARLSSINGDSIGSIMLANDSSSYAAEMFSNVDVNQSGKMGFGLFGGYTLLSGLYVEDGYGRLVLNQQEIQDIDTEIVSGHASDAGVPTSKAVADYVAANAPEVDLSGLLKADLEDVERLDPNTLDISTLGPGTYPLKSVQPTGDMYQNETIFPDDMVNAAYGILNVYKTSYPATQVGATFELIIAHGVNQSVEVYVTRAGTTGGISSKNNWKKLGVTVSNTIDTSDTTDAVSGKAVADYVAANAGSGLPEGGTEGQVLVKTATGAEWKSLAASDDDFCTYFGIPSMT